MPKRPSRKAAALASVIAEGQQSTQPEPSESSPGRRPRIMYIERKAGSLTGAAKIGRVTFSKTGGTLYYRGQKFQSLKGQGFKSNYNDVDSGEDYWISGLKRDGSDRLYGERTPVEIDEDI